MIRLMFLISIKFHSAGLCLQTRTPFMAFFYLFINCIIFYLPVKKNVKQNADCSGKCSTSVGNGSGYICNINDTLNL